MTVLWLLFVLIIGGPWLAWLFGMGLMIGFVNGRAVGYRAGRRSVHRLPSTAPIPRPGQNWGLLSYEEAQARIARQEARRS